MGGDRRPPYGFSPEGVRTWLPQPESWAELTVEAQLEDPESMLKLYRRALRLRHEIAGLQTDAFAWRESPGGVLDFERGPGRPLRGQPVRCAVPLGDGGRSWWRAGPLEDGLLPHDSAAWLVRTEG